jgi:TatD DNase family protein
MSEIAPGSDSAGAQPIVIDSHCHLADPRLAGQANEAITRSITHGVSVFIQGGVGPEDWAAQASLAAQWPGQVIPCFGLHPYWVAAHSRSECEVALENLEARLDESIGLGECGLDFREKILTSGQPPQTPGNARSHQIEFFLRQVALANRHNKVPVFHIVHAHEEALTELKSGPALRPEGIVHAFHGAPGLARRYMELGLSLSIGAAVIQTNADGSPRSLKFHETIASTPLECLLLESDSPDQPRTS